MSEENVELMRRYVKAFNASGLAGTRQMRHGDVEVFDPPELPDAGRYVGERELRRVIDAYLEIGWDGQFHEPEILDAGEEVVLFWRLKGTSPHEAFPVDTPVTQLYLFDNGRVRRIRQFLSREAGLKAAGLSK